MSWEGFPSAIKVGYRDFKVVIHDRDWSDQHHANGQCSKDGGSIHLSEHLTGPFAVDVALHEILHAAWYMWEMADDDKEERVVSTISTGLTTVLRDNPALLTWIEREIGS